MMQANELRIGNWVKCECLDFEENYIQLDNIHQKGTMKNDNPYSITKLEPIPLTEEWLLKFGFENRGVVHINEFEKYNRFVFFNTVDETSNYEVHFLESTYGNQLYKEIIFSIDNESQRVKQTDFVHNLQNHFKISVGYELILKP